ncbi:MAG: amidophosphoribosyltransferase [Lachnospiraceae bacterium]|nr:amidophosphoribosyltransferase [Lachnospiraceae bacterium]MBP5183502.1 amidophosphoribosyltransferase [Lachnospiraceae bacterium]
MGIHEECGVFGIIGDRRENIAEDVYYGLYALQHRGQESCGIVVNDDGVFAAHKDLGLVGEVFTESELIDFPGGKMAIGHVRYGTTGGNTLSNIQPMVVSHQKGNLALSHNGNLTNALELRDKLELTGAIFHSTSDTETICYMITRERLKTRSIEQAVQSAVKYLEGAFSLVMMSATKLIAVRDPKGFRPLCYGKRKDGAYVVASESCALDAVGASFIRDVEPGEMLVFSTEKPGAEPVSYREDCGKAISPCIFEYIYFARPDSTIDGVSVHETRVSAGRILAREFPADADVVVGVPDSGLDAALGFAQESGIPYEIGLIKNKYVGRSFIAPSQGLRTDTVRIKLSPVRRVLKGKRVVLIDDSIVRGTTSKRIINILREAGAKEIHLRISSPPFRHPCFYGVDIDSEDNLIANHHTPEQIAELIGADSIGFLPIGCLKEMSGCERFCSACFDGEYPSGIPKDTRKDRFERKLTAAD